MTEEEKQEIIDRTAEKVLLMLPEVTGNLMLNRVANAKLTKQFFSDHPEFKGHGESVESVLEMVEGNNPFEKYETILEKAVPEIKRRIETIKVMDTTTIPSKPDMKVHGEI